MKIVNTIIVIVCLAGIGFVGFYFFGSSSKIQSSPPKTVEPPAVAKELTYEDKQRATINDYFERQSKGLNADGMFCVKSNVVSFYSVRKWEILSGNAPQKSFGDYIVRVESSNKAGVQITADYTVSVWTTEDFKQTRGDYCIKSIYGK